MKPTITPPKFWFANICNYGLYPVLILLSEFEKEEQYEICADIVKGIKLLDELVPLQHPRETREEDAWGEYAAFWSKRGQSPTCVAMEMSDFALQDAIDFYSHEKT